jgi:putative tricarboxylic transport membrane protein
MKITKDLGTGIGLLALSLLYITGTFSISTYNPFGNRGMTSKSIPQLLGGIAVLLSILQIAEAVIKGKKAADEKPVPEQTAENSGASGGFTIGSIRIDKSVGRLFLSLLFICAYIFFFNRLGFILSSVLFLLFETFFLTPAEKRKKWAVFICCLSAGLPVLIYLLFTKSLSLFLPRGLLG